MQADKTMKRVISILMENQPGALSRITGLFSQRGFNIDSLCVAKTDDPTLSRLTIATSGDERVLEQIIKQVNKLIDVLRVSNLTEKPHIERELVIVKVNCHRGSHRDEILRLAKIFSAPIIDVTSTTFILQFVGAPIERIAFLSALAETAEIIELARSGIVGIQKGKRTLDANRSVMDISA